MNNFPAMTEEQRRAMVKWLTGQRDACDEIHARGCKREQCMTAKIALAALTAEPVAYARRLIRIRDGQTEAYKITQTLAENTEGLIYRNEVTPLYTAPPAPVLRLPEEADTSNLPFAAMGWNACLAEVKRLNNQPEPTEASNEQR